MRRSAGNNNGLLSSDCIVQLLTADDIDLWVSSRTGLAQTDCAGRHDPTRDSERAPNTCIMSARCCLLLQLRNCQLLRVSCTQVIMRISHLIFFCLHLVRFNMTIDMYVNATFGRHHTPSKVSENPLLVHRPPVVDKFRPSVPSSRLLPCKPMHR